MQLAVVMLGVFRSSPSSCALAFGVPRYLASCACQRGVRSCHNQSTASSLDSTRRDRSFQTRQVATGTTRRYLWAAATKAAATEAAPPVDKATAVQPVDDVEEFESEMDAMMVDDDDAPAPSEKPPSPGRMSLLESNVNILEQDCEVAQLFVDAAASRKDSLYLGLDISTRSTGYAVLRPSTDTMATPGDSGHSDHDDDDAPHLKRFGFLREVGEASLVEWGCISGNGSDGKKGDEVDVGVLVEEALVRVAARCGRTTVEVEKARSAPCLLEPSEREESGRGLGATGVTTGEEIPEAGVAGQVWVVGVEDFMRRFLPGKSNAKSIFALAQLNGIVKYACLKHLGAKASSFHPSTPRSFYGLTKNKPEGKEMKEIVHDFALSQEKGTLETRFDWPLCPDGSKADASFDVTDAYLIARYSWHRDVFRAVADNNTAKDRFAASFQSLHRAKLQAAEKKSLAMLMNGDMPAVRGKKKRKPMTERCARNAHRKLQDARFTKAYETSLMEWFQQRVLGASL